MAYYHGTSMAAPHVAGVAALMVSANPSLTPAQFDALLASGAITRDLADNGPTIRDDSFGYGLIDAYKSVVEAKRLAGGGATPPTILAQPSSLAFGDVTTQLNIALSAGGTGPVAVTGISANAHWLTVSGGGSNGLGSYVASVNRSGLPEADYSATLSVATSNAGTLRVPVTMRVGAAPSSGDPGVLYALLLDIYTFQTVAFDVTTAQNLIASFQVRALPSRYYLVIGSDNDYDLFICDAGETCGVYPALDEWGVLDLRGTRLVPGFAVYPDTRGVGQAATSGLADERGSGFRVQ